MYTWSWEDNAAVTDTLVTVEFHERGKATEVILRHTILPGQAERDNHQKGWIGCLEKLATIV